MRTTTVAVPESPIAQTARIPLCLLTAFFIGVPVFSPESQTVRTRIRGDVESRVYIGSLSISIAELSQAIESVKFPHAKGSSSQERISLRSLTYPTQELSQAHERL